MDAEMDSGDQSAYTGIPGSDWMLERSNERKRERERLTMEEWKARLSAEIGTRMMSSELQEDDGETINKVDMLCGIAELVVSELHDTSDPDLEEVISRDGRVMRIMKMAYVEAPSNMQEAGNKEHRSTP